MHHVLSASLLQAGACGVSLQMGRHASEAAGSSSSEASYSGRTGNSGSTDVWLQHAWKLPASPHLAVAAEGMVVPSSQKRLAPGRAVARTAHYTSSAGSMGLQACQRSCTSSVHYNSCS